MSTSNERRSAPAATLLIAALVCAVAAGAAPIASAQEKKGRMTSPPPVGPAKNFKLPPVTKRTLANGLNVLFIEDRAQPILTMTLLLRAGASSEPDDRAGLARMTAGLLDQGTASRSAQEIAEAIDSAGGGLGASAGWDSTTASTTVLVNKADLAADLLADILRNPTFKDDEIDRSRTQSINALQLKASDAGAIAQDVFEKAVYGASPYAHPIDGTTETIRAITRDDIVAFHKRWYVPNNATIAVVGALGEKDALALVEKHFGGWQKGAASEAAKPVPEGEMGKLRFIVLDKPDAAQTEIRAGMTGIRRTDPDYFTVMVTNAILGGAPFSSRIEAELRVKRGLTYGARSRFDSRLQGGAFYVSTNTKTETTREAVDVILEQVTQLRGGDITENELKQRQGFLAGMFLLGLEKSESVANQLLTAELYGLGPTYLDTYTSKIQSVTVDDVRRIAKLRIVPDQFVIVLAGNAAEFEAKIREIGPVEKIPFAEVDVMAAGFRRAAPKAAEVSEADAKAGAEMVSKTIAALGGDAFTNQKSAVLTGTGTLSPAPGQNLPIQKITSTNVYPDKDRNELDLGMIVIKQVSTAEAGWLDQGGQIVDTTAQTKDSDKYGLDVLRRFGAGGWTARPMPDVEVGGKTAKTFAVSDAEGHETVFTVDAETHLPIKVAFARGQAGTVEVAYSDYRDVSGVKIPFALEQKVNGATFLVVTYTEAEVNADVDPALFERP